MSSNQPDPEPTPLPMLTPEEARQRPGFYYVTSSIMPDAEILGTGKTATLVCLMMVTDGKMFICNPTQEVLRDQLAKGLIFQGPLPGPIA